MQAADFADLYDLWATPEGERGRRVTAAAVLPHMKHAKWWRSRRVCRETMALLVRARGAVRAAPRELAPTVRLALAMYHLFGSHDHDWCVALAFARECQLKAQYRLSWEGCLEHCVRCDFSEYEGTRA